MIEDICSYIEKFDEQTKQRFYILHKLVYESTTLTIKEKLWAKLPSYYAEDNFVRIIPFKDHLNIEAKAIQTHIHELSDYKTTPKGMLQVYHNQEIPDELLRVIFKESLE
ncbi:MAG: DUF1801 domain-containing protein [Bacillota bacterium]